MLSTISVTCDSEDHTARRHATRFSARFVQSASPPKRVGLPCFLFCTVTLFLNTPHCTGRSVAKLTMGLNPQGYRLSREQYSGKAKYCWKTHGEARVPGLEAGGGIATPANFLPEPIDRYVISLLPVGANTLSVYWSSVVVVPTAASYRTHTHSEKLCNTD